MRCPYIPYNIIIGNATTIVGKTTIGNVTIIGNLWLFPFPLLILFMVISSDKGPNQPCGNREIRIKREIHNLLGFKVLLLDAKSIGKVTAARQKNSF